MLALGFLLPGAAFPLGGVKLGCFGRKARWPKQLQPVSQYAEEALRRAVQSKNEKEQLALIELMRAWTQTGGSQERVLS
ncbi:MAG: hypothetical protein WAV78_09205 [Xanthobacteraceae bacterium]